MSEGYGRLRRFNRDTGEYLEVVDVTELAIEDGRTVNVEWTEVVLLGSDPHQDGNRPVWAALSWRWAVAVMAG